MKYEHFFCKLESIFTNFYKFFEFLNRYIIFKAVVRFEILLFVQIRCRFSHDIVRINLLDIDIILIKN